MSCITSLSSNPINLARWRAANEVILLLLLMMLMSWSIPALAPELRTNMGITILVAIFSLTFMSHISYGESLTDLGLTGKNFLASIKVLLFPVGILTLVLLLEGFIFKTLHFNRKLLWQILGIPFWGLLQQYIAQSFVNRRLQIIFAPGWLSIGLTGLIFGAMHLPNPALTIATTIAGLIWAYTFQRAPNLYSLALSHGLLSALFVNATPKWLLHSMVVGYNYLVK